MSQKGPEPLEGGPGPTNTSTPSAAQRKEVNVFNYTAADHRTEVLLPAAKINARANFESHSPTTGHERTEKTGRRAGMRGGSTSGPPSILKARIAPVRHLKPYTVRTGAERVAIQDLGYGLPRTLLLGYS